MRRLKAGIVGCGGIANAKHLPAMAKSGLYEITAFCDVIEERAKEAKDRFGSEDARVFLDYRELVQEDLDVVYVTTPNRSHADISIAAMEAGKDVMCEKPMARTYEEAQRMLEAAGRTKRVLNIAYQNRYRRDAAYLKELCRSGEMGEIYFAKAHALRRRAVPTWGVFLNEEEQGGGPLIDIGTHALDLTLWMMDNYEVASVTGAAFHKLSCQTDQGNAFGDWDPELFKVEDSAFGFIRMKNGAVIELEASWALNTLEVDEAKTSICGTKAGADMKDGLRINRIHHNVPTVEKPELFGGAVDFFSGDEKSAADVEQELFYRIVADGAKQTVEPEQAAVVTRILEAVYRSAESGLIRICFRACFRFILIDKEKYMDTRDLKRLLSGMSLREKIGQMIQLTGMYFDEEAVLTGTVGEVKPEEWVIRYAGSVLGMDGADKIRAVQEKYMEEHPHHIPLLFMADIIHGYKTIAPIPLGQACSFHPELVHEAAEYAAAEASSEGIKATFSPMVDVSKDPRWGRIMESFGEDPFLNGVMGIAMLEGYQGYGSIGGARIAGCLKHFAGYERGKGIQRRGAVPQDIHGTVYEAVPYGGICRPGYGDDCISCSRPHAGQ